MIKNRKMPNMYMPTKDADLKGWTTNFLNVGTANAEVLGISPIDFTPVEEDLANFSNDLQNMVNNKAIYDSSVTSKNIDRASLKNDVRNIVKRIQANPAVPDILKIQLGITVPVVTPNKTPPVSPTTVVVNGQANGINTLKWKTLGNKPATQYMVQAKILTMGVRLESESGWTIVGQTTKRKFNHTGITPGTPMAYRIVAARASQTSTPSLPVTIYTS